MKHTGVICGIAVVLGCLALQAAAATNVVKTATRRHRTPQEMEQLRMRRKAKFEHRTGGWLIRREKDAGCITFVNAQKRVGAAVFEQVAESIRNALDIDVTVREGVFSGQGEKAFVYVIDEPSKPGLVVVPEEAWAVVNVAKLAGGDLDTRTVKEMWRAFAYMAGSADSQMNMCLMQPVFKPEDLDAIPSRTVSPEPLMRMERHLRAMGIKRFQRFTYKDALMQGWAPMPINENQRGVYDKWVAEGSPRKPAK